MSRSCFLNPGELYFGGGDVRVETLLGPCVAIVLWFPHASKGGICHFQLPGTARSQEPNRELDGRYGVDAWLWLCRQMRLHGLRPEQAQIKLFGGARSISSTDSSLHSDIGAQNIAFVEQLLADQGLKAQAMDLGGEGSRFLRFELASGELWLRRGAPLTVDSGEPS
ncbi:chemotaxis protein CheD [Pseudomonas sp. 5P_3.1_Bac2]|uniref:chemotaxis protein CheD n=1 Tax=Pseudomonas sp. 5P_3.1_Bac2 TaxID=2971617 RepID=UPI0021C6C392|nr:chemotaxis protein CheD [Pseudomonas sp. 5P_3.1_Bac2]MCU1719427.1 chemotaxis protein CheD [Pseudomonas sp. 5P_3.1_Bac2]